MHIPENRTVRKGLVDAGLALIGAAIGVVASLTADLDPQVAAMVTSLTTATAASARRVLRDWHNEKPSGDA